MTQRTTKQQSRTIVLVLVALLLPLLLRGVWAADVASEPVGLPTVGQTEAPSPFVAAPAALTANVLLGERQEIALTITNAGDSTTAVGIYAANAEPPAGVVPGNSSDDPAHRLPPSLQRVALPDQDERVDPQIARAMASSPDGAAEFLVFLKDQPDLSAAYGIADWNDRGWFVYTTLTQHAAQSQQELRALLTTRGVAYRPLWITNALVVTGDMDDLQALEAHADVAMIMANAAVRLQPGDDPIAPDSPTLGQDDAEQVEWNIAAMGASRVWADFGVTGAGITVANIDSGVQYEHPALLQQYRGYQEDGTVDHAYNWFDPARFSAVPSDSIQHGTHVMGTIVGRSDPVNERDATGVAPGARWIAARGCSSDSCLQSHLIESAQWMLAPTDANNEQPRPDLRPHIVNNSWSSGQGDDGFYLDYTTAWRAAGIMPVFAIGNRGNTRCSTGASPADYANVLAVGSTDRDGFISSFSGIGPGPDGRMKPDITAPGGGIRSTVPFSSSGFLNGTSMATPHVVGTIALLWSANPELVGDYDATYELLTSTAEPKTDERFVAPAYGECSAESTPNNIYGYGGLDAYAAVAAARVAVPWIDLSGGSNASFLGAGASQTISVTVDARMVAVPGTYQARLLVHTADLTAAPLVVPVTLTVGARPDQAIVRGTLRDATTSTPLAGSVLVADGPRISVGATGTYSVVLPVGAQPVTYTLQANALGYSSQNATQMVVSGSLHLVDFKLTEDLPRLSLASIVSDPGDPVPITTTLEQITATLDLGEEIERRIEIRNVGTRLLDYTVTALSERFGIARSDRPNGLAWEWIDLPADATRLVLTDDGSSEAIPLGFAFPFYGATYTQTYVSANGFLAFGPLPTNQPIILTCPPVPETSGPAILPLRTDLDPSAGGQVRAGPGGGGFVLSYEDVPLYTSDPTATPPRFTYQVVLLPDGRIRFHYQQLGELPSSQGWGSVGVQRDQEDAYVIGCTPDLGLAAPLALELQPQQTTSGWLDVAGDVESILDAGQSSTITVTLQGNMLTPEGMPYLGTLQIESNDPDQRLVQLPVELTTNAGPYRLFLSLIAGGDG